MTRDRIDIPDKRLFRPEEVARLLGVHRTTVWRMIQSGELPALFVRPRIRRVPREALVRILTAQP